MFHVTKTNNNNNKRTCKSHRSSAMLQQSNKSRKNSRLRGLLFNWLNLLIDCHILNDPETYRALVVENSPSSAERQRGGDEGRDREGVTRQVNGTFTACA